MTQKTESYDWRSSAFESYVGDLSADWTVGRCPGNRNIVLTRSLSSHRI